MSSELFNSESDLQFFSDDPAFPFDGSDSIDDILRSLSPDTCEDPANVFETKLESLNLCQANQLQPQPTNAASFSMLMDGFLQGLAGCYDQFLPHSYSGESLSSRYFLQRSHSSGCFGDRPRPVAMHGALLDSFSNSSDFQGPRMGCSSPEGSVFSGNMRRVCSTGDLQNFGNCQSQSPAAAAAEGSLLDDTSFKVGRYSAEQRKERIMKYRAKRTQRNFNKTIKYACRKTLADSRPRIRGRFARNDDTSDIPKAAFSNTTTDDDDDDIWGCLREADYMPTIRGGPLVTGYDQARFQFCSY